MRRNLQIMLVLVAVMGLVLPALAGDKASSLYDKGKDAEARQDYERRLRVLFAGLATEAERSYLPCRPHRACGFESGAAHVHAGQQLRDQGNLEAALVEFQRAAAIDPSSFIAQQEIRRTQAMLHAAKSANSGESVLEPQSFKRRLEASGGVIDLQPISKVPITLKLTEDSKVIYDTIGKLAGINVLFDPDYNPRRVHIELNGVTLAEALELVSMETKTFWRTVTPNTIFVAADTPAKRKELEQNLIKTFYLSNLSQPTELQDVVNTLRTVLEVSRLTQIPSQSAIVVRGTPDQLALAEKLIDDLDKARPEVIVDVLVMVINREHARTLGVSPPTSATVALNGNTSSSSSSSSTSSSHSSSSSSTTATNQINLNSLANLNATDFLVTIPSLTVNVPGDGQQHQAASEPADSRFGRTKGIAQDRPARACGDRFVRRGRGRQ